MQHTMKNNNTLIIDGHEDIAWNALELGRDVLQSVYEGRAQEKDNHLGERLVGFPELLKGRIGLVFATTFVPPASHAKGLDIRVIPQDAQRLHQQQMQYYQQLTERTSQIRIVKTWKDVQEVLSSWDSEQPQVGLVMLMEGADGILEPEDVGAWYEEGLRIIGLSWAATRYAGGTAAPGGLTKLGRRLLKEMASLNLILDLSHLAEEAYYEAVDSYESVIIASHANPNRFLPTDRALSDEMINRLVARDGVIGVIPYNCFLLSDWKRGQPRDKVGLSRLIEAIDTICQIAGSAQHVAIGSDFDGGFGLDSIPPELDSIADLYKIGDALSQQGYIQADIEAVLKDNWLRMLKKSLPTA